MKIDNQTSWGEPYKSLSDFAPGTPVRHQDGSLGIVVRDNYFASIESRGQNRVVWLWAGLMADILPNEKKFREVKAAVVVTD